MTLGILSMTFNDLTSLKRVSSEINSSKSETDPPYAMGVKKNLIKSQ